LIVDSADAPATLKALRAAFVADLRHHDVEHISVNADIAIVAIVGEKMRGTQALPGERSVPWDGREFNIIAYRAGII
jgi:aspartokinase